MIPHLSHVMTLANSIIGVSVLAMPFCFKQCGIVLAILVLLTSSVLSRLACHFLIKSAVMSRRRNFEFLAFHAFGKTGKFFVELFIIGFLLGTCVAFFVVVGDLGPQIIGKIMNKRPADIRTIVLVMTGIFIVLPLGLLRNIDSLSSVCTATIGFYLCLVLKVICESTRHIFLGDWYDSVMYWRPAGILHCLPIFSMALFCQTQLFEIYEAIPNVCLEKMNQVVRGALNICTVVYLCVGFFGYVAFCTQPFTGNILMSFEPSLSSDVIKMGFVFSVAFSFPLVIFPCRASMNSLLFRRAHTHDPTNNYIPEVRFRCLTLTIVSMALGTGILIPNIEFLLSIVGSTIGVMICLIFPAAFFIAISTKNTNERLIAQAILFFGMWIMVLGTYANIYTMEETSSARLLITTGKPLLDQINDMPFNKIVKDDFPIDKINLHPIKEKSDPSKDKRNKIPKISDVRQEPPIPVERAVLTERPLIETKNSDLGSSPLASEKRLFDDAKSLASRSEETKIIEASKKDPNESATRHISSGETMKSQNIRENSSTSVEQAKNENLIDSDAIKKEETELEAAAAIDDTSSNLEAEARREKLRRTLEKHRIDQLEMMREQKKLLEDIKEQKEEIELSKKRLASEQAKNLRFDDAPIDEISPKLTINEKQILDNAKIMEKPEKSLSPSGSIERDVASLKIIGPESRGPILNALTNWTMRKFSDDESLDAKIRQNDERKISSRIIASEGTVVSSISGNIVETNESTFLAVSKKLSSPLDTTSDDSSKRRDILEDREFLKREKREIDEITKKIVSNDDEKLKIVDLGNLTNFAVADDDVAKERCESRRNDENIENLNSNDEKTTRKRGISR